MSSVPEMCPAWGSDILLQAKNGFSTVHFLERMSLVHRGLGYGQRHKHYRHSLTPLESISFGPNVILDLPGFKVETNLLFIGQPGFVRNIQHLPWLLVQSLYTKWWPQEWVSPNKIMAACVFYWEHVAVWHILILCPFSCPSLEDTSAITNWSKDLESSVKAESQECRTLNTNHTNKNPG